MDTISPDGVPATEMPLVAAPVWNNSGELVQHSKVFQSQNLWSKLETDKSKCQLLKNFSFFQFAKTRQPSLTLFTVSNNTESCIQNLSLNDISKNHNNCCMEKKSSFINLWWRKYLDINNGNYPPKLSNDTNNNNDDTKINNDNINNERTETSSCPIIQASVVGYLLSILYSLNNNDINHKGNHNKSGTNKTSLSSRMKSKSTLDRPIASTNISYHVDTDQRHHHYRHCPSPSSMFQQSTISTASIILIILASMLINPCISYSKDQFSSMSSSSNSNNHSNNNRYHYRTYQNGQHPYNHHQIHNQTYNDAPSIAQLSNVSLPTIDGQIKTLESIMKGSAVQSSLSPSLTPEKEIVKTNDAAASVQQNQQQQQQQQRTTSLIGNTCAAPEVLVNGSPSPDIAGTVSGGDFTSIEEIQFVGIISSTVLVPASGSDQANSKSTEPTTTTVKQKRICKIKCLNGVWIGPLCALENTESFEPVLRSCKVPRIANASIVQIHSSEEPETESASESESETNQPDDDLNDDQLTKLRDSLINEPDKLANQQHQQTQRQFATTSNSKTIDAHRQLPHGSIINIKCKEIGLFKMIGNDELQCVDGLWDKAIPSCESTTIHQNFSLSSPPTILYTLLDGTLGVDERGQIVVLPGAILHLDCLFQKSFGQPRWTVSDSSAVDEQQARRHHFDTTDTDRRPNSSNDYADRSNLPKQPNTAQQSNEQNNSPMIDQTELSTIHQHQHQQQHSPASHRTTFSGKKRWHQSSNGNGNKNHRSNNNNAQQSSDNNNKIEDNMDTVTRDYNTADFYNTIDNNSNKKRVHTTGWAILTDEHSWKYRLAIYYANNQDTGRYTCTTPNGMSNSIDIIVKDVSCPPIDANSDPNRVMSVEGNRMHDRIRFSCVSGFKLVGQFQIRCKPNGFWSHSIPSCKEIRCNDIDREALDPKLFISGSGVQRDNRLGAVVNFRCPIGYRLRGKESIHCTHNSVWSHPVPVCEQITCDEPAAPENGQIMEATGRYLIGDYIQFVCNQGHVMEGQPIASCLENGDWSFMVPECKSICEFPGEFLNGYFNPSKFQYDLGEEVRIECDAGYRLDSPTETGTPSNTIVCQPNGQWNKTLPECKAN